MMDRAIKNVLATRRLITLAVTLGMSVVSSTAFAAFVNCSPNQVEYSQGNLLIQCAPVNYAAQSTPPSACAAYARNVDTQKIWANLAQAALLSGKSVRIYYDVCSGSNIIGDLVLIK